MGFGTAWNRTPAFVKFGFCVSVVGFIVTTSLVISSVQHLAPLHYGLDFNKNTNKVAGGVVYGPGRYVLGIGHKFIEFPSTLQSIDFSGEAGSDGPALAVFSSDGQTIFVDVSIQYELSFPHIMDLYNLYGRQFEQGFVKIVQSTLKNVAVQFDTRAYFQSRRVIADRMFQACDEVLKAQFAFARLLQLRRITLPPAFEQAFIDTAIADQREKTNRNLQLVEVVLSEIDVINGRANAEANVFLSVANSQAFQYIQQARANALQQTVEAEAAAVAALKSAVNFNNTRLLQFLWTRTLRDETDATLLMGAGSEFGL